MGNRQSWRALFAVLKSWASSQGQWRAAFARSHTILEKSLPLPSGGGREPSPAAVERRMAWEGLEGEIPFPPLGLHLAICKWECGVGQLPGALPAPQPSPVAPLEDTRHLPCAKVKWGGMEKECLAWPGAPSPVPQGKSGAPSGLSQAFHALRSPTVTTVNPTACPSSVYSSAWLSTALRHAKTVPLTPVF